jgi:hypothetical protein
LKYKVKIDLGKMSLEINFKANSSRMKVFKKSLEINFKANSSRMKVFKKSLEINFKANSSSRLKPAKIKMKLLF